MIDDFTTFSKSQLDAVERQLSVIDKTGGPDVVTTLRQGYATSVAELWDACTVADRLAQWFAVVSGDLHTGGRYQIEDNAEGTIESCDPPHGFRATWEFQGSISWVAVQIDAVGSGAHLSLSHKGDTPQEFWDTYGPGAGGVGWDLALLGLAYYLATGVESRIEGAEWMQSEDAREFITDSSRRWADAWIAVGADEAVARAAEQRTTAFFTGQETEASPLGARHNTFDIVIALPTEDRQRAYAFAQALGFDTPGLLAEDGVPEPLQVVVNERTRIMYIPTGGFGWVTGGQETAGSKTAECLLSLSVDSPHAVDELMRTAEAAGAKVIMPPEHRDWGYNGTFADPDSHLWEVLYPLM